MGMTTRINSVKDLPMDVYWFVKVPMESQLYCVHRTCPQSHALDVCFINSTIVLERCKTEVCTSLTSESGDLYWSEEYMDLFRAIAADDVIASTLDPDYAETVKQWLVRN